MLKTSALFTPHVVQQTVKLVHQRLLTLVFTGTSCLSVCLSLDIARRNKVPPESIDPFAAVIGRTRVQMSLVVFFSVGWNAWSIWCVLQSRRTTSYSSPRGFLSPGRVYQATDKEAASENLWLPAMRISLSCYDRCQSTSRDRLTSKQSDKPIKWHEKLLRFFWKHVFFNYLFNFR